MTDSDCNVGYSCGAHNICVADTVSTPCTTATVVPHHRSTVTKVTTWTSTVTTCANGECHPCTVCPIYTCIGDACNKCDECEHKKAPIPTITIVECAACEGGYTTSTCYPDVTTTITACNTCITPVVPVVPVTTPVVPVIPATTSVCATCVVPPKPTLPVFISGAERNQIAYAGLVGVVAMAAFML
jgi:hypothetical protein